VKARRFLFSILTLVTGCGNKSSSSGPPPPAPPVSNVEGGADPQTGDIRYLALGDSISQGYGVPDMSTGAFPARLAEHWRARGCKVVLKNLGARHNTSQDVITNQLPQIAPFKPTLITLQVGSNDMGRSVPIETYRKNVRTILEAAKGSGARVVVIGQNEWHRSPEGPNYGKKLGEKRDAFDGALTDETKANGTELVDLRLLYRQQADKKMWNEDGIHPTAEAYDQMAAELARVIPTPCAPR